jgi:hypothetical protein
MHLDRAEEYKTTNGPGRSFGESDRSIDIDAAKLRVAHRTMGDCSKVHDGVDAADKRPSVELRGDIGDRDLLDFCGR